MDAVRQVLLGGLSLILERERLAFQASQKEPASSRRAQSGAVAVTASESACCWVDYREEPVARSWWCADLCLRCRSSVSLDSQDGKYEA
jgi:hypothetical protein